MLILPIKEKWFRLILQGEKREEYREIKPYYESRFKTVGLLDAEGKEVKLKGVPIAFRNGYRSDSPTFVALCWLSIGYGRPEWGAEVGKKYYRLHVLKVLQEDDDFYQECYRRAKEWALTRS